MNKDNLRPVTSIKHDDKRAAIPDRGTLGTGQRFTPKKRTVPMSCFESGIDHIVYQLYGLTEEEIKIVEQS